MNSRIFSPRFVPPGSRVSTTEYPASRNRSASILAWVDLPAPSPPSNVMNLPVATYHRLRTIKENPNGLFIRETKLKHPAEGKMKQRFKTLHPERAFINIFRGIERHFVDCGIGCCNAQDRNLVALLDRWFQGPFVDNRCLYLAACGARQENGNVTLALQVDIPLRPAPDEGIANDFTLVIKLPLLERAKPPFQKFSRFLVSFVLRSQAVDDHHEALITLLC